MSHTRPVVAGLRSVVSSGHYLASAAAHDILMHGGNAVDAGCAAGMVLGVVQPDIVNIAGVAPIMIRMARSPTIITIAGLGSWPQGLPDQHFITAHGGAIPVGVERCVVPAAPDAWITALRDYGTMTFADVANAAIRHACDGFVVYPLLANSLRSHEQEYRRWPTSRDIFFPQGRTHETGELFVQSDLAATLTYMADEERSAGGSRENALEAARNAFYSGDIARKITEFIRSEGGFLTMDDMRVYRSKVEEAIVMPWRGMELAVCGAWCQGPVLAQALRILEQYELGQMAHNSARMIHIVVEALKCAFSDREHHYGDPSVIDVPLDMLMSEEHASRWSSQIIDPDRAMADMPAPLFGSTMSREGLPVGKEPKGDPDTSYVAIVDREGNAFSATPSDGSWSVPIVPGTGLVPSARGSQSRPDPRHPSGAAAGKRPRLTPSPAMLVSSEEIMPFGTPGGDVQPQAMLQFLLNRYVYGMDIQAAVDAPRFATYSFPSSFAPFTQYPGLVKMEPGICEHVATELLQMGHTVEFWPERSWLAGGVCAVSANHETGIRQGGADPRRPSYAIGC